MSEEPHGSVEEAIDLFVVKEMVRVYLLYRSSDTQADEYETMQDWYKQWYLPRYRPGAPMNEHHPEDVVFAKNSALDN